MPLHASMINQIAGDLTGHALDGDEVVITRQKVKDVMTEYFKEFLVHVVSPREILNVAEEMELVLADDELEYLVEHVQNNHDGGRGPTFWPGLADDIESMYLEDTEDGSRKNAPDFWVVKVDETEYWNKGFLSKHKIKKISNVYLVDKNETTTICSAERNYCFWYITYVAEHEDPDEQITDEADMEIMSSPVDEIHYVRCSRYMEYIDDQNQWRPTPLNTDMYEDEEAYKQLLDQVRGDYHECPIW